MEFKEVKLGELVIYLSRGIAPKYTDDINGICVINQKCIRDYKLNLANSRRHNITVKNISNEKIVKKYDILINSTGVGTAGRVAQNFDVIKMTVDTHVTIVRPDSKKINPVYLGYTLKHKQKEIEELAEGSTGQTEINRTRLENDVIIRYPDMETQAKIAHILSTIDKKIELNNRMNETLLEQINIIYKKIFTNFVNYKRLDEIANITIGKTPSRLDKTCFTNKSTDIKWISIGDLGKSGVFIFDTKEKLTQEAIKKYNIKIVPPDTLIVSFKLTIGRTGFTTENTTTNEAIAHFDLNDKTLKNYLYCTLNYYNYNNLGSTSSIATAINSKILKAIKVGLPTDKQVNKFNSITTYMFKMLKKNEKENIVLTKLRDTLLPKLMASEINLDNVKIKEA